MCMFCINCGACGKKISQELQEYNDSFKTCRRCGTELELGQLVCPNCHYSVLDAFEKPGEEQARSSR